MDRDDDLLVEMLVRELREFSMAFSLSYTQLLFFEKEKSLDLTGDGLMAS